jgi:putative ABC transport system permease protein
MFSDFRFALRTLARSPVFTAVAVLTLALGIGSTASIFSIADRSLFRGADFPADVVAIGGQSEDRPFSPFRPGFVVEAYEQRGDVFSEFGKARYQQGNIVVEGRPVATTWTGVSANAVRLFGLRLQLGRSFLPGEDNAGADHVVILSDWFWRQTFAGDENIIGRRIIVGDDVCTIVGVLADGQRLPGYLGGPLLRPLVLKYDVARPWESYVQFFGRLRAGVTRDQAQAALRATTFVEPPQFQDYFTKHDRAVLVELKSLGQSDWLQTYWLMLGAVGFLYAIACLNASNLMLVRMLGQRRELSVRLALGASRWRVIRLLLLESAVLAGGAGLLGMLMANWLFPLLLSAAGNPGMGAGNWANWRIGWRVAGVLASLSLLTSLLIALLPAWRVVRTDINSGLKEGGGALGESPGLARLRGGLVVLQAAFAMILLAGAGLMIRSFQQFQKVDFGFEPVGLHKVTLQFPPDAPRDWQPRLLKLREIEAMFREIPGVQGAGFGTDALLPGYLIDGSKFPGPDGKEIGATIGGFDPGFRETVGLRLKAGHWFTQERGEEVIINESFARALWPGQDPIGKVLLPVGVTGNKDWIGWTVIGVVGDLRATMREGPSNHLYRAEGMEPQQFSAFVVRTAQERDPAVMEAIRRRLYQYDSRLIVHQIATLTELRDQQLWLERMANSVLQVLAGIALLLTLVGIFSVLAYTVDRRLGEFGVRLALGATGSDLVQLVSRRALALTLLGIGLGLGGALGLTRFLKALLFETTPNDPWVLGGVAALLLLTATGACVLPARRAARVDVAKLLRSE